MARVEATYEYTAANGDPLFVVERLVPKAFRQKRPDGNGGWEYDLNGVRRVLYRLPRVLAAKKAGEPIFLCEGEKDVHTLERFGKTATTVPGGAGKWEASYTRTLRGAKVTVIGDADRAGLRHVLKIAQALHGEAEQLRVFLPDPLKGDDVSDLLADCRDPEQASQRLRSCLVAYELQPQENVTALPDAPAARVLVDRDTGEVIEPHSCSSCQQLQDQLDGATREIRAWRARYAELAREAERDARSSPWWPVAVALFGHWRKQTGHRRSQWTFDRFRECEPLLKRYGPEMFERAIAGIAYDPFVTVRKNGSRKRHDGWELLCRTADRFEEFCNRAPGGWAATLDLRPPEESGAQLRAVG